MVGETPPLVTNKCVRPIPTSHPVTEVTGHANAEGDSDDFVDPNNEPSEGNADEASIGDRPDLDVADQTLAYDNDLLHDNLDDDHELDGDHASEHSADDVAQLAVDLPQFILQEHKKNFTTCTAHIMRRHQTHTFLPIRYIGI
jgi:hypothetical protein